MSWLPLAAFRIGVIAGRMSLLRSRDVRLMPECSVCGERTDGRQLCRHDGCARVVCESHQIPVAQVAPLAYCEHHADEARRQLRVQLLGLGSESVAPVQGDA